MELTPDLVPFPDKEPALDPVPVPVSVAELISASVLVAEPNMGGHVPISLIT